MLGKRIMKPPKVHVESKKKVLAIAINNPHAALNKHILIKLLMEILKHTHNS